MIHKIEKLLNAGLSKEEYNRIQLTVAQMNMKTLQWVSLLISVLMYVLVIVTLFPIFPSITVNRYAYLFMGIASIIVWIIAITLLSKKSLWVKPIFYLFMSCIIAFSIYIGVFTNVDQRGSTICVLLLVIPLLITDRPMCISIFLAASTLFFCIASYMVKDYELFSADFVNCVCMLVVSIAVNFTQQATKCRSINDRYVIDQYNIQLIETQKEQLEESKIAIMLSQIQPHFLYNALLVIQELCHTDPVEAEKATIEFSKYLRGNLDSLSADAPIEFDKEIEHTKHYLALEQKRFGKKLKVEWNLHITAFSIPALSLQPIVENAVRYGVTKKKSGGTVWISTEEEHGQIIITVKDDGVGFDITKTKDDGRTHIGISNVKKRIEDMCKGTLTIESTENVGTTATITIPRNQTHNEEGRLDGKERENS